ncbi:nicotinamidase [Corynebacterium liangguodongii]|uniref:nicotinamidase n=1 Tax=Corynebacterium liangguodongii TaxID=2079535 RepID=A0A2S0WH64_9CORY|nr:nicotinamidase [Corynebacterium liangguodongii]AWB85128.1 nicotinamidase [Corynebacterium liangguodongii]PWB98847.1 nicotinamidase [Corynebacterium liangguodongii]
MTTALVIVDVQNDFCPGGTLATSRGDEVARHIAALLSSSHGYESVVATQDWHIAPGAHFSPTPDYADTWPVHCVAGSEGARLHPALDGAVIDAAFHKGEYSAAYSGFEAGHGTASLAQWLRDQGITRIDVCGIATDHCVRATVLDGLKEGFAVTVLADLCSPVDDARGAAALDEMHAAGAALA